jgi:hypothetical protein
VVEALGVVAASPVDLVVVDSVAAALAAAVEAAVAGAVAGVAASVVAAHPVRGLKVQLPKAATPLVIPVVAIAAMAAEVANE